MKKKVSLFVGLPSRKQRRKKAKENGTKFEPQYNGNHPERVQHKDVLKIQKNEIKYKEKQKKKIS